MTTKEEISKTLLQLHAGVITVEEAEKIIFQALSYRGGA